MHYVTLGQPEIWTKGKRDERKYPGNPVAFRAERYRRRKFHYSCNTSFIRRIGDRRLEESVCLVEKRVL